MNSIQRALVLLILQFFTVQVVGASFVQPGYDSIKSYFIPNSQFKTSSNLERYSSNIFAGWTLVAPPVVNDGKAYYAVRSDDTLKIITYDISLKRSTMESQFGGSFTSDDVFLAFINNLPMAVWADSDAIYSFTPLGSRTLNGTSTDLNSIYLDPNGSEILLLGSVTGETAVIKVTTSDIVYESIGVDADTLLSSGTSNTFYLIQGTNVFTSSYSALPISDSNAKYVEGSNFFVTKKGLASINDDTISFYDSNLDVSNTMNVLSGSAILGSDASSVFVCNSNSIYKDSTNTNIPCSNNGFGFLALSDGTILTKDSNGMKLYDSNANLFASFSETSSARYEFPIIYDNESGSLLSNTALYSVKSKDLSKGALIAIIVCSIVAGLILLFILYKCCSKRKEKNKELVNAGMHVDEEFASKGTLIDEVKYKNDSNFTYYKKSENVAPVMSSVYLPEQEKKQELQQAHPVYQQREKYAVDPYHNRERSSSNGSSKSSRTRNMSNDAYIGNYPVPIMAPIDQDMNSNASQQRLIPQQPDQQQVPVSQPQQRLLSQNNNNKMMINELRTPSPAIYSSFTLSNPGSFSQGSGNIVDIDTDSSEEIPIQQIDSPYVNSTVLVIDDNDSVMMTPGGTILKDNSALRNSTTSSIDFSNVKQPTNSQFRSTMVNDNSVVYMIPPSNIPNPSNQYRNEVTTRNESINRLISASPDISFSKSGSPSGIRGPRNPNNRMDALLSNGGIPPNMNMYSFSSNSSSDIIVDNSSIIKNYATIDSYGKSPLSKQLVYDLGPENSFTQTP